MSALRILFPVFGSQGDLRPLLAVGRALIALGHRATIATHASFEHQVQGQGLDFHPLRPEWHGAQDERLERQVHGWSDMAELIEQRLLPFVEQTAEDLLVPAREHDVMVIHPLVLSAPSVAEHAQKPWISIALGPWYLSRRIDERTSRLWTNEDPRTAQASEKYATWAEPLVACRRRLGLGDRGHPLLEGQVSPLGTLALFSPTFAPLEPAWGPRVAITGFPFLDAPEEFTPELAAFLDRGDAPIVFTMGSAMTWLARDFFRLASEVCERLGRRAVLVTGRTPPEPVQGPIFACERASFSALFPRALAVVHHGGIGTTAWALRAGKPMLIVPLGGDQPDNAVRARRLRVARWIPRRRFDVPRAVEALGELLADARVRESTERISLALQNEDGARDAAEAILRLARVAHGNGTGSA